MKLRMFRGKYVKSLEADLAYFMRVAQTQFRVDVWVANTEADTGPFDMHGHIDVVWECTLHDLYIMAKYGGYKQTLDDLGGYWVDKPMRIVITP